MKIMKAVMGIVAVAVVIAVAAGVYLYMNLDAYAKMYAERVASETLGVGVSIGGLHIDLKNKSADVRDVKISNPRGFKKPYALTVDQIHIALKAVSEKLIDFQDVDVKGTNAYLEVKPEATNFLVIKNQMKNDGSAEAEAVRVIIQKILMTEMMLYPSVTLLQTEDLEPVKIPNLSLSGIGRKENGILAREAIAQIWSVLAKDLNSAAGKAGYLQGVSPDSLKEMGVGQIETLKNDLNRQLKDKINSIFD